MGNAGKQSRTSDLEPAPNPASASDPAGARGKIQRSFGEAQAEHDK